MAMTARALLKQGSDANEALETARVKTAKAVAVKDAVVRAAAARTPRQ
jgi:hypothetical protein